MASRYQIHNELTAAAACASRDLKSFRDGDEVKVKVAENLKPLKATVCYPGLRPGTLTVYVPKWGCTQTFDEDQITHARR